MLLVRPRPGILQSQKPPLWNLFAWARYPQPSKILQAMRSRTPSGGQPVSTPTKVRGMRRSSRVQHNRMPNPQTIPPYCYGDTQKSSSRPEPSIQPPPTPSSSSTTRPRPS
ncbi:hypothetical protein BDV93DRAFT_2778 [Ceratobasidium sp. AG-I]|nr:hypothetical protein BDV93DRAFT_2778 [Ceratobasidium sp. AG-I]